MMGSSRREWEDVEKIPPMTVAAPEIVVGGGSYE